MAVWMSMDQFAEQLNVIGDNSRAPCPSEFPEGDSFWIKEYPIDFEEECHASAPPTSADMVIIGSGITGAAFAYHLANRQPHLKVAMVEARGICTGATGRNGGHICRAEAYELRTLAKTFGADEAVRMRTLAVRNRDMMLDAIDSLGIADEVDLQLGGTIAIFGSEEERDDFQKDLDFAKDVGMPCEGRILSPEETTQKFHVATQLAQYGSAYLEKSGSIYPRKLVAALLRDVRSRMPNFSIHPYNPATSVAKLEAGTTTTAARYMVNTKKGPIQAQAVIHATNAYASRLIPSLAGTNGVFGCKCEVIAIQPTRDGSALKQLRGGLGYDKFWHWLVQRPRNGPFIYGWSGVEKIGDYEDDKTVSGTGATREYMADWLEKSLPHNFESIQWDRDVKNCWAGIQGMTLDGTSCVGRPDKERPGEFMSVAHNGEGMGRCFAAAFVLVDRVLHFLEEGGEDKDWVAPEWFPTAFLRNM